MNHQNPDQQNQAEAHDEQLESANGGWGVPSGAVRIGEEVSGIIFKTQKYIKPGSLSSSGNEIIPGFGGTAKTGLSDSGKKIVGSIPIAGITTKVAIDHKDEIAHKVDEFKDKIKDKLIDVIDN